MASKIIPHKLLIGFNEDGTFKDGILIYQTSNDKGEILPKYNTVQVNSEISVPVMNGIIQKAITFAKNTEGVKNA